MILKY
jgi:hypothetical protein